MGDESENWSPALGAIGERRAMKAETRRWKLEVRARSNDWGKAREKKGAGSFESRPGKKKLGRGRWKLIVVARA